MPNHTIQDLPAPDMLDTAKDLAHFLKVSTPAVRKWTRTTDIPCVRIGRAVRYDRLLVLAWCQARQAGKRDSRGGAVEVEHGTSRRSVQ